MTGIGGYFQLELNKFIEFHDHAIRLNSGRNALHYALIANNISKIHIPYFTCDVVLDTVIKSGIPFEQYNINGDFEPIFNFQKLKKSESFLYTNYFGLKNKYIAQLEFKNINLIIDNAQAFYHLPTKKTIAFYSPRKFFGVPDGGYLYCEKEIDYVLEEDKSYERFLHLTKRIDLDPESGYKDFVTNEMAITNYSLKSMSKLTQAILKNINYNDIKNTRIENYEYLNQHLSEINGIQLSLDGDCVPLSYPLLTKNTGLRKTLTNEKIYTPVYWPETGEHLGKNATEIEFTEKIIHLPIDQRISKNELNSIIKIIKSQKL